MSELTSELLTPVLREHLGDAVECESVRRGPAGNGQEIWFLELTGPDGRRELVLRRTAAGGTMSYTDRAREYETLRRVAAAGLPVPAVYWYEPAGSSLTRDYFVMERLPGAALGPAAEPARAGAARQLGEHLARLHALGGVAILAADATRAELAAWRERHSVAGRPGPILIGALLAWLERNTPALDGDAVLLWGDPGPHNMLFDEGRISGLLDWEMSHPGHPYDDLAVAVWSCLGQLDPELVIAGYESAAGSAVDRELLDWFEVLAGVTRAIALACGVADYVAARISAPATAGLGLELLSASLERAAIVAGWEQVETPALAAPPPDPPALRPTPAEADLGVARLLTGVVLPEVADARLRRLLKNAAALLETGAERAASAATVAAWRNAEHAALLETLSGAGVTAPNLDAAAQMVESEDRFAEWRAPVRRHLLEDLALERAAFGPLRKLYGSSAAAAPRRVGA